jgi:ketosteroid isomerase-like protein
MKHLVAGLLMACGSVGLALADMPSPTVSQTLQQLETDWANAIKDGDVDKVASYLADDWTGLAYDGKLITKKKLLADIKSGKDAATSVEMGPMEVKVLGKVAVVQGSDVEKSTTDGKDTSGKWVWTDVFEMRDGKWLAVRSQSAMLK